ncbi:MAG: OmpA family protein [Reichenbachiella sp.]
MSFRFLAFLILILGWHKSNAQSSPPTNSQPFGIQAIKGEYYFSYHNYTQVENTLRQSISENSNDLNSKLLLAESYYLSRAMESAAIIYRDALKIGENIEQKHVSNFIESLVATSQFDILNDWIKSYNDSLINKTPSKSLLKDSSFVFIQNLQHLNSENDEMSLNGFEGQWVFSSNRSQENKYDIYYTDQIAGQEKNQITSLNLSKSGQIGEHFGIASQSKQIFFTQMNEAKGQKNEFQQLSFGNLQQGISATFPVIKLSNKLEQNINQVTVNETGDRLILVLDNQANGKGFDLFSMAYNGRKWSKPNNMIAPINSVADELYPKLVNDSILFFSSNRAGGAGGLDIYKVNLNHETNNIELIPAPINSAYDDLGYYYPQNNEGYISSNRPGGLGAQDLYKIYSNNLMVKDSKDTSISKEESNLSLYLSSGRIINLSIEKGKHIQFELTPAVPYTLHTEYYQYNGFKLELDGESTPQMNLPESEIYTFHIQKILESIQNKNDEMIQDIHVSPGDLIIFQLIPNSQSNKETSRSKIRFDEREELISADDKIVFGYFAKDDKSLEFFKDSTRFITDKLFATTRVDSTSLVPMELPVIDIPLDTSKHLVNIPSLAVEMPTDTLADEMTLLIAKQDSIDTSHSNKEALASIDTLVEVDDLLIAETSTIPDTTQEEEEEEEEEEVLPEPEIALNNTKQPEVEIPIPIRIDSVDNIEPIEPMIENTQVALSEQIPDTSPSGTEALSSIDTLVEVDDLPIAEISPVPDTTLEEEALPDPDIAMVNIEQTAIEIPIPARIDSVDNIDIIEPKIDNMQVVFRVQISAALTPMGQDEIKRKYNGPKPVKKFKENKYYKYYIFESPDYQLAKRAMLESGVPDAFIVAYQGDVKWNLKEAVAFQKKNETKLILPPIIASPPVQDEKIIANSAKRETNTEVIKPTESSNTTVLEEEIRKPKNKAVIAETKVERNSDSETSPDQSESKTLSSTDFEYRIQIANSTIKLTEAELANIYSGLNPIQYKKIEDTYYYYIAGITNYFSAKNIIPSLSQWAYITPYKNGQKMKLKEALAIDYKVPKTFDQLAESDSVTEVITTSFELDQSMLDKKAKSMLNMHVVQFLLANTAYYAMINGFTDVRGSNYYNYGLSKERANAVKKYLISQGINESRVNTQYFGESQLQKYCPEQGSCDESIHQANRRAEILLLVKKK